MLTTFKRLFPLLLLIFIDSFSFFVVIPVLLQLFFNDQYQLLPAATTLTTRTTLTGFTIALSTLAALMAALWIGSASDHIGRKKTLLICVCAIMLGFLFPIIGITRKNIYWILVGRFLAGVGSASQPVAQAVVADLCTGKEKAFFLSLIAIMMTLPIIVGPLAGGYLSDSTLVSWFNVTTPYWVAFLISSINIILLFYFFQETNAQQMSAQMLSLREIYLGLTRASKKYHLGRLLLIFFSIELAWSQYYQFISLYLNQAFHYPVQSITQFNTYMGVLMALGLLFLYPLLMRFFSLTTILRYSLWLMLAGFIACAWMPTITMQWLAVPLIAIFTGTAYVSSLALISHQVPANQQGWAMGYTSTILFLAWMVTGFAAGLLMIVNPLLPFYASALVIACACIINWKF